METIFKLTIANILMIIVSIFLSNCKSPVAPTETSPAIIADTIATFDSTRTTDVKIDTVVSRMPLTLIINNLASPKSPVYVSLYNSRNKFLSETDRLKGYKFIPHGDILTAQITDVSYGEFSLATYQDVNLDGKCDKNFVGRPKEPYGFSNNYRPKLKAPNFGDCSFAYNAKAHTLTIEMIR